MTPPLRRYYTHSEWTAATLPTALRKCDSLPEGQWAEFHLLAGTLTLEWLDETGQITATFNASPQQPLPLIPPPQAYRLSRMSHDLCCQCSLLYTLEDYGHVKYDMTRTHSEVIVAAMSTEDYRAQCRSPLLSVPEHYAATIPTLARR